MKPKDLKSPFSWKERRVAIQDRVLFVPEYFSDYVSFSFPGFASPEVFGNNNPVRVEYCSGNGSWILDKAENERDSNFVAIEMKFERVRKIYAKMKNRGIQNLFIVCGEALLTTRNYFSKESVQEIFINFPDPWPKKRHAKHRLIRPEFIAEMHRILQKGGQTTVVTDDPVYSDEFIPYFFPLFTPLYEEPFYKVNVEEYGSSYFHELWVGKGKEIRYHVFRRF